MVIVSKILSVCAAARVVAGCASDEDCHLNGVCTSGTCACVPEWTGETCGELNLHPARPSPQSGYDEANTSSWGGSIIASEDGLHHMFVSRMVKGGGLDTWTTNSEIIHATSEDPEGPYSYNETILGAFAHGPSVRSLGQGKGFMMMHLGCGRAMDAPGFTPCTQFNVSVMTSASLLGPWSDSRQVFLSSGARSPSWYVPSGRQFSNPAPWIMANGSMICAYRADARSGGEHVSVAVADSLMGPYIDERSDPVVAQWSEDPFIWQDERGHWHILLHGSPQGGDGVGGHAFSRSVNGPWTLSMVAPYTQTVMFADSTTKNMRRRERPQLLLSPAGQPRYFSSGVEDVGQHTYTLVMRVKTGHEAIFV